MKAEKSVWLRINVALLKRQVKTSKYCHILGPLKFDFHAHKKRASTCPLREKIATKMPENDE